MPGSDTQTTDLWAQVSALLLHSLGWVALGAALLGAGTWTLSRWRPRLTAAVWSALFGTGDDPEPTPRRFLRVAFGLLWIADGLLQAQPLMASSFATDNLPADQGPGWFMSIQASLARAWLRHPVAADVATVWVQIGLGLLLLVGGRGLLAKLACWATIAWSLVIWFVGESLGGLFAGGAGWLTGAPGAALVYALAAALLLMPVSAWRDGRAAIRTRRLTAGWLAVAAFLTALPSEGFWTASGLSAPFADGVGVQPSAVLRAPISQLGAYAIRAPHTLNLLVVTVLGALAVALWLSGRTALIVAALGWCLLTWWLGQNFGVLGGTATDPNTALPLALLLAAALPAWRPERDSEPSRATVRRVPASWTFGVAAATRGLAVGLALVLPAVIAAGLPGPADAAALAVNSNGGLVSIAARPLPGFALADQRGAPVSPVTLRGKVVVLTFLDPVCDNDCPIISAQLAMADRRLGPLARSAEFVAVDTNPVFTRRADVAAFTESHGLSGLANWHFLWGPSQRLLDLLAEFGITVDVPAVGMIEHAEGLYFVAPDGRTAAYLSDGAAAELTSTYARQVRAEIEELLR
jgi:cytochrome oxidase Cu insertion factor (SCO1/SenC/PrrC family)